jgi:hypothetical protein
MLTINDLHNEQELSSFEMDSVAGGMPADQFWGMYNAAQDAKENPQDFSTLAVGLIGVAVGIFAAL